MVVSFFFYFSVSLFLCFFSPFSLSLSFCLSDSLFLYFSIQLLVYLYIYMHIVYLARGAPSPNVTYLGKVALVLYVEKVLPYFMY